MFKISTIVYKFVLVCLLIIFPLAASSAPPETVPSFPILPNQYRETKFSTIQENFEQRSVLFLKGRQFHNWQANKSQKAIFEEFDHLNEWRLHTWYVDPAAKTWVSREDFMIAQDLLEKGYYQRPQFIAFQYNQTDSSYNSSSIVLNGGHFLALEAPMAKTINNFIKLLINHQVTQLVDLTSGQTKGVNQSTMNTIASYSYSINNWTDEKAINPKNLLKLIDKVRKEYEPTGLLACYCPDGAGRTGTFLAGLILLNEIDKQIASNPKKTKNLEISIEKIVMQLSLQRPYMVSNKEQYLTLYRLVDLYTQSL